ncbi:MAG: indole-3-glycerol phosphate synthase TrpC [Ferruginibacter sp.]
MNILDTIVAHKKKEVAGRKKTFPVSYLEKLPFYNRECISLKKALLTKDSTGIIAEFKRKSPSKGFINEHADVATVTKGYTEAGAAGLSVLTDNFFFGGSTEDLITARANDLSILRKDFIIDPYQVTETKAMGADLVLLIAACLSPDEVKKMAQSAVALGMEVLLELHEENELGHICEEVSLIGINNRNLKDFTVNINASLRLAELLPPGTVMVAESGIDDPEVIETFREKGFKGFLIGETFMKENDPGAAFGNFVQNMNA